VLCVSNLVPFPHGVFVHPLHLLATIDWDTHNSPWQNLKERSGDDND
jgi:hypothetical protein